MKLERWKWVRGYEGLYKVSSLGRVRSLPHVVRAGFGSTRVHPGRLLKVTDKGKCAQVALYKNGTRKDISVSHLVLEAFIGPCPLGHQACHSPDSNIMNNQMVNLRWGTPAENSHDRIADGTVLRGENNPAAKLSKKEVRYIRRLRGRGWTLARITKKINKVDLTQIWNIVNMKEWRDA